MSIEKRLFGEWDGRFHDNETDGGYGPGTYGEYLADALMHGREKWEMPDRTFMTANYLVQMLRITGRTGRFSDELQGSEWDDNVPTLDGADDVRHLREVARDLRDSVSRIRKGRNAAADVAVMATLDAVDTLFQEAARLDLTRPSAGVHRPLAHRYTLPKVTVNPTIGAEGIWYVKERNVFCFGGYEVSPKKLGRILAITLMRGEEWIVIGDDETEAECGYVYEVTVNYVLEMLRETGLYKGDFFDADDETFDPNVPTHEGWGR